MIGTRIESIPSFLRQYIQLDVRDGDNFEARYTEIVREIYNDPAIKPPEKGAKPTFD